MHCCHRIPGDIMWSIAIGAALGATTAIEMAVKKVNALPNQNDIANHLPEKITRSVALLPAGILAGALLGGGFAAVVKVIECVAGRIFCPRRRGVRETE
ncbi:MAG: hypothetical protein KBC64_06410 [Simkaniaceae bacterium]|nr:hypothetical protein [Simkaniaceae bacterium]